MKKEIESNKEKEQNTAQESLQGGKKNMREQREKEYYRLHTDRHKIRDGLE